MKLSNKILIATIGFWTIAGCTDEIPLNTTFEPQMYVFGILESTSDILTISIQETVPLTNSSSSTPINNARIALYTINRNGDSSLVTDEFTISNKGEYASRDIVEPVIGNSYWIEVALKDGAILKSDVEILRPIVPIHNVINSDGFIKVTFTDSATETNFYVIDYTLYDILGNELHDEFVATNDVLFNGNTNAFVEIDNAGYANGDKVEVGIRNVNFNNYQFYRNVSAQIDQVGADPGGGDPSQLFASPPANITGNITNTKTGKKVLGAFVVYSINTKITEF